MQAAVQHPNWGGGGAGWRGGRNEEMKQLNSSFPRSKSALRPPLICPGARVSPHAPSRSQSRAMARVRGRRGRPQAARLSSQLTQQEAAAPSGGAASPCKAVFQRQRLQSTRVQEAPASLVLGAERTPVCRDAQARGRGHISPIRSRKWRT